MDRHFQTSIVKWIFLALTVGWMILIFWFSARPGQESTEMSMSAGEKVAYLFVPGYRNWTEEEQKELAGRIDYPVRKCAHAAEYMVLAVWVFLTVSSFRKKSKGAFIPAWLITTAYAATDEIHQLFVPGRSGRATDVCIDAAGALVGILFCFLVSLIRRKIWNGKMFKLWSVFSGHLSGCTFPGCELAAGKSQTE